MKRSFLIWLVLSCCVGTSIEAQTESEDEQRPFVKGGFYDKPHLFKLASGRANLGGYAEAHFRFEKSNGIVEERTFVPKRFNVFFHSFVSERFRMAAELEFEEGTEEILMELAILDFELSPALTFRAGMLLSPLGKFNLAHDSPANKMTDRPLATTQIIPTALAEPGAGIFGAFYPSPTMRVTYELYAVNGFSGDVVEESDEGTRIAAGKHNIEDNNNSPAYTGRFGISPTPETDFGFSFHTGQYNTTFLEDISVDEARNITIIALDADYVWNRFHILGEYARASIDLPAGLLGSIYSSKQQGLYAEGSASFFRDRITTIPGSYFEAVVRYDWVDYDTDITGDHIERWTLGLNFRPTPDSVFKFNYLYNWTRDRNNVEGLGAGVLASVATYF